MVEILRRSQRKKAFPVQVGEIEQLLFQHLEKQGIVSTFTSQRHNSQTSSCVISQERHLQVNHQNHVGVRVYSNIWEKTATAGALSHVASRWSWRLNRCWPSMHDSWRRQLRWDGKGWSDCVGIFLLFSENLCFSFDCFYQLQKLNRAFLCDTVFLSVP